MNSLEEDRRQNVKLCFKSSSKIMMYSVVPGMSKIKL